MKLRPGKGRSAHRNMSDVDMSRPKIRKRRGAAITEFGAAFVVLVIFLFVPLVNLSFIGVKFLIAQGAIQEFTHRLALSEKRSDSYTTLASDEWWSDFCSKCGVDISQKKLNLIVCSTNSADKLSLASGQKVPADWLPGGAKAPCIYTYDLAVTVSVPPIYSGGPAIPGITSPIAFQLEGHSAWENLSRNPASTEYYINE